MNLDAYKSNTNATENGAWFYINADETAGFLVARLGCKGYRRAHEKHLGEHTKQPNHRPTANRAASEIEQDRQDGSMIKVISESVVRDWKEIEIDGKSVKYSVEACIKLLGDPAYIDLLNAIIDFSKEAENFRASEIRNSENA